MPQGQGQGLQNRSNKGTISGKTASTVQTLLAAKVDKDKNPNKRTHSEVSNESNNSIDLSGLTTLQKDMDDIKVRLDDVAKKSDLQELTKELIKKSDLENVVTIIVNRLLGDFKTEMEKSLNEKLDQVKSDFQEKLEAMSIENEDLKRQVDMLQYSTNNIKRELHETTRIAQQADISSNYNEQYSRKNNIKVMNFPRKEKQDLRADFMETVKRDLNIELDNRDVVAIHRIPSKRPGPFPVIVKLFSSDVKRKLMRDRKSLKNKVKFVDDVTQRNMHLIEKLNNMENFDQVWYYNCGIYARTYEGGQFKFGLYDKIHEKLQGK